MGATSCIFSLLIGSTKSQDFCNIEQTMPAMEVVKQVLSGNEFANEVVGSLVDRRLIEDRFLSKPSIDDLVAFSKISKLSNKTLSDFNRGLSWPQFFRILFLDPYFSSHFSLNYVLLNHLHLWHSVFLNSSLRNDVARPLPFISDIHSFPKFEDEQLLAASPLFDPIFYIARFKDIADSDVDPLLHYLSFGGCELRNPSFAFDSNRYFLENPDLSVDEINPLIHWIRYGFAEGRKFPAGDNAISDNSLAHLPTQYQVNHFLENLEFDQQYYLSHFEDVRSDGIDPRLHFVRFGWREDRNPSPSVDIWYYKSRFNSEFTTSCLPTSGHMQSLRRISHVAQDIDDCSFAAKQHLDNVVAIHLHLFHVEMLDEFVLAFKSMPCRFDLYISVCGKGDQNFVENFLAKNRPSPCANINVYTVINRGRDIAPFVNFIRQYSTQYTYICHLHSKKSEHSGFGDEWRRWVLDLMFGSTGVAAWTLDFLDKNPACGMLFPENFYKVKKFIKSDGNMAWVDLLLQRIGIDPPRSSLSEPPHFAAGSMAWFRTSALSKLALSDIDTDEFDLENGQVDLTLAHVMERALPAIVKGASFNVVEYFSMSRVPLPIHKILNPSRCRDGSTARWIRDTARIALNKPVDLAPICEVFNRKNIQISWIIPDFKKGAGGHMTIFRIVAHLHKFGHRQTIYIQNVHNYETPGSAKRFIEANYMFIGDETIVQFLPEDVKSLSGDAIICTDCWTAFPASTAPHFKARYYLIQDFEPYFYPVGEQSVIAELTYRMGMKALCAGEWLQDKAIAFGMWSRPWYLAADQSVYNVSDDRQRDEHPIKIAFYCRSYTPRRVVGLGIAALMDLHLRGAEFEVYLFGEDTRVRDYPFKYIDLGILDELGLANLYRQCHIGMVFSATNYSLIPLEMMSCGLPVVELLGESTLKAFGGEAVCLAKGDPRDIADKLEWLANSRTERSALSTRGYEFASQFSWDKSARLIEDALVEGLLADGYKHLDVQSLCKPAIVRKRHASVVIPTLNGGDRLKSVVNAVLGQDIEGLDLVVVDSGSSDDALRYMKGRSDQIRLISIDPHEFGHGKTRNLAISHTDCEYVALLTQDATPADSCWLRRLISGFETSDCVAATFGRHDAYAQHGPLIGRDLSLVFDKLFYSGPLYSYTSEFPSHIDRGSPEWLSTLRFYSDNNSAMRRSVWEKIPYPDVSWSEDILWCWEIMKLGFSKVYVDEAVVFHSHRDNLAKIREIGEIEREIFEKFFGEKLHEEVVEIESFLKDREFEERRLALMSGVSSEEIHSHLGRLEAQVAARKSSPIRTR